MSHLLNQTRNEFLHPLTAKNLLFQCNIHVQKFSTRLDFAQQLIAQRPQILTLNSIFHSLPRTAIFPDFYSFTSRLLLHLFTPFSPALPPTLNHTQPQTCTRYILQYPTSHTCSSRATQSRIQTERFNIFLPQTPQPPISMPLSNKR